MKKIILFLFLLTIGFNANSQCGCDVVNCATQYPNVTLFNIYYGDNVTLTAPPLPANNYGVAGYGWFVVYTKTTDDPNPPTSQYSYPFINYKITSSITFNPLEELHSNPTEGYFMCRTNTLSCSGCTTTCFYGRSFKVVFKEVPVPVLTVNQNLTICPGQSVTLSATNSVGSLIWRENSITGNIVGTGNAITVSPTATKTYVVYANNGSSGGSSASITNSQTVSVTVTVAALPSTPTITQSGNTLYSTSAIGNQWYSQNGIINGAVNQNYTPTGSGNYYVIITENGCSSTSSVYNYTFLANDEFVLSNNVKIYPNPTNSKINIDFGSQFNFIGSQVKLSNMLGQEFYNSRINQQKTEISLSSIATKGVYFISIVNSEGKVIATKKIILN